MGVLHAKIKVARFTLPALAEGDMTRVVVGSLSGLPDGRGAAVRIGTVRIALFRIGERVLAIEDRCTHRGFPLNDGALSGDTVRCRTHGACFDLVTGNVVHGPARRAARIFAVEIAGGEVTLILPDGSI